jgi:protein CpxP
MKKLILSIAIVVIGFTAAHAQDSTRVRKAPRATKFTAEQRAEMVSKTMQQKLALTDDQKQKVYQVELDRVKKNDEWRKQDENAMKGKMDERKAFLKASKDKMDAILTADQRKTLAASRDEMRAKMKDRKGPKGPRRGDRTSPPAPTPPANN